MATTSYTCASCLRAARTTLLRNGTPNTFRGAQQPTRAFSKAAVAATSTPLYLDFLAPNALRKSHVGQAMSRTFTPKTAVQRIPRRSLATTADPSAPRPAQAVLNPRNDEAGRPMQIAISPRASKRLQAISTGDNNPNLALRVTIESGGCHGFQYLMDLTDLGEKPATEEDTVFEGEKGEKVVIDESSLELLNGSTVDYTMELIGSQFKITGIPGATSSCGCGTSFDIKL